MAKTAFYYIYLYSFLDILVHLCKFLCLVGCDTGIDDLLDVSVHDLVQLIESQVDPVVGHTSLWEVIGTDLLGTISRTDLASSFLRFCILDRKSVV